MATHFCAELALMPLSKGRTDSIYECLISPSISSGSILSLFSLGWRSCQPFDCHFWCIIFSFSFSFCRRLYCLSQLKLLKGSKMFQSYWISYQESFIQFHWNRLSSQPRYLQTNWPIEKGRSLKTLCFIMLRSIWSTFSLVKTTKSRYAFQDLGHLCIQPLLLHFQPSSSDSL